MEAHLNGNSPAHVKSGINGAKLDFKAIEAALLARSRDYLSHLLPGGELQGHEYVVRNPTRSDGEAGSFKVNVRSGKWADFASGQSGRSLLDLAVEIGGAPLMVAAREAATWAGIDASAPAQAAGDVTLEVYAKAKKLDPAFLRSLGLETVANPYAPRQKVLAIPYRDASGEPVRMRYRVAMEGKNKTIWDRQKERGVPGLYGLERVPDSASIMLLVEGESDAQTAWSRGYAALGVPGVMTFKAERDAAALAGLDVVVLQEPGEGGEALLKRLRSLPDTSRIRVAKLDGFKDVSELHCQAPERFDAVLDAAIAGATPLAAEAERKKAAAAIDGEEGGKRTQADVLVEIAMEHAELFATPDEELAHAAITVKEHREVWPLRSRGFKRWLTHRYFLIGHKAPNSDAMNQALATLDAVACYTGKTAPIHIRRAEHAGKLYIDLGDEAWRAIEIAPDGWRIVTKPPVYFIRTSAMAPLPIPQRGGSIDELRPFLTIANDEDFLLIAAYLAAALRSRGPYPILAFVGEGGTAKTSTARLLRSLIDPHAAKVRRPPQSERDLFIGASKTSMLAYDNLSSIGEWLSDALCVVATGGTYTARQLHTDDEEMIFSVCQPVMITSVGEVIARSDLASRAITITLAPIPDDKRKSEGELDRAFEAVRPRIFGALLDAMSHGLAKLPSVSLAKLPRMADFMRWAQACEGAFGWPEGSIYAAFDRNAEDAVDSVLGLDTVAVALMAFLDKQEGHWKGQCEALLEGVSAFAPEGAKRDKAWPRSPQALTSRITMASPLLRKRGINIERGRDAGGPSSGKRVRWIELSSKPV
jgi:hypothetical protein